MADLITREQGTASISPFALVNHPIDPQGIPEGGDKREDLNGFKLMMYPKQTTIDTKALGLSHSEESRVPVCGPLVMTMWRPAR